MNHQYLCCNFLHAEEKSEIKLEQITKTHLKREKERECLIKIMKQFLSTVFRGMNCQYINVFRDLLFNATFYLKRNLQDVTVAFDLAKIKFHIKDIVDIFDYETIKTTRFNKYLQLKTIYLMEEQDKQKGLLYIHYSRGNKNFGFFLKLKNDLKIFLTCLKILMLNRDDNVDTN